MRERNGNVLMHNAKTATQTKEEAAASTTQWKNMNFFGQCA